MSLTEATIKEAIKRNIDTQIADGKGRGTGRLVFRIRRNKCEWYAQQWIENRKRMSLIGKYPNLTLNQARIEFASKFQSKIILGDAIPQQTERGTLRGLFSDYVTYLHDKDKPSAHAVDVALNRVASSIGGDKLANRVTSDDVIEAIRPVYESGAIYMADYMRAYVCAAFNWAIKSTKNYRIKTTNKYNLKINPASGIPCEGRAIGDRWLSINEVRNFWHWKREINRRGTVSERNYDVIRMLFITGLRPIEILTLRPSMMNEDMDVLEWEKTKNGRPHVLPMNDVIREILARNKPKGNGYYFFSHDDKDKRIGNTTLRYACQMYCKHNEVEAFTPQDIRRTWTTMAGHAELTTVEKDLIQNHVHKTVTTVHYDRYDYLKEKRKAMEQWTEWFIETIIRKKDPN